MNIDKLKFPVIELDLETAIPGSNGLEFTGLKTIYKKDETDPEKWLGYHTKEYKLITNEEVIDSALEIIADMDLNINKVEEKLTWSNDRKMHLSLILDKSFDLGNGDKHNLLLNVYNSYDGSLSYGIDFGTYRMICSNGAYIGVHVMKYRKRHFNEFKPEVLRQQIEIAVEKFPELEHIYNNLKATELNKTDIDKLFEDANKRNIIAKKDAESIYGLIPDVQKINAYAVFNIFTLYLTHMMKSHERAVAMNEYITGQLYRRVK